MRKRPLRNWSKHIGTVHRILCLVGLVALVGFRKSFGKPYGNGIFILTSVIHDFYLQRYQAVHSPKLCVLLMIRVNISTHAISITWNGNN